MEDKTDFLEEVGKLNIYAQQYVKDRIELVKIEAAEQSAKAISLIATMLMLGGLITVVLLLLTVAIGLYLGDYLNDYPQAFLIISGIYFLIGLIFFLLRKRILTNPITIAIVKQALSSKD